MKADVQSPREREALEWAVEWFKDRAARLDRVGSRKSGAAAFLYLEEMLKEVMRAKGLDYELAIRDVVGGVVLALQAEGSSRCLSEVAALMTERGEKLPKAMQDFVVEFMRDPNPASQSGPSSWDLVSRNGLIYIAMLEIVEKWKFPATRRRLSKRATRPPSAASIVKEALAKGAGLNMLSEDAINKIWAEASAFAKRSGLSEKTP